MAILDDVKKRIGINDKKQDEQLQEIINGCIERLLALLPSNQESIPSKLEFIVKEVAVKRYNRIGAEGMKSESVDGRSNSYESNDFEEYHDIIEKYFDNGSNGKKGRAMFF
ncbi:phage head-tail connector protein [Staphylococcus xylosus]